MVSYNMRKTQSTRAHKGLECAARLFSWFSFWLPPWSPSERERALALFLDEMVARHGFERSELDAGFRLHALRAPDPRVDEPGHRSQTLGGVPFPLRKLRKNLRWRPILAGERGSALARPGAVRRSRGDRDRGHRHRDPLRTKPRAVQGPRGARDPRVRVPAARERVSGRARALPAPEPRGIAPPRLPPRLVCRRHGDCPVHAGKLSPVRHRLRRRRKARFVREHARRDRKHRQLPDRAWMAAERSRRRSGVGVGVRHRAISIGKALHSVSPFGARISRGQNRGGHARRQRNDERDSLDFEEPHRLRSTGSASRTST